MLFVKKSIPNGQAWLRMLEKERGRVEARRFMGRVIDQYWKLHGESEKYPNRALQKMHLETNILPALALYREF
ncbi:MAG: hypothetical protein PVJ21_18410 [Anaerolineales bacterium]